MYTFLFAQRLEKVALARLGKRMVDWLGKVSLG